MSATILAQLAQINPAAALVAVLVVVVFAGCILAAWFYRAPDDNGLKYEGTYTSRTAKHNGRQ